MTRPFLLGLTGSIGMGKTTTAQMFADEGIPVWDADAAVHRLYTKGGGAVAAIAALRPEAVRDGSVDRGALKAWIAGEPSAIGGIEAVVHPLVAADRMAFIDGAARDGAPLVVLDIPLLYETGADGSVDATIVVTAPAGLQRARVLSRPGMDTASFEAMLARQLPDVEKRRRARYIVETLTPETARAQVRAILKDITARGVPDA